MHDSEPNNIVNSFDYNANIGSLRSSYASFHASRSWLWYCDAICFLLVTSLGCGAFVFLGLQSPSWAAAYAYVTLRIIFSFQNFMLVLQRNFVFLLYPALCFISVLWSDIPKQTLVFSVQLLMTCLIGCFFGTRFKLGEIFALTSIVLAFLIAASFANLNGSLATAYSESGHFIGIFSSKNALGHRLVMAMIIAIFGAALIPSLTVLQRFSFFVLWVIGLNMVLWSGSATALVMVASFTILAIALGIIVKRSEGWKLVLVACTPIVAGFAFVLIAIDAKPIALLLELLGKDPTLTGRSVLWQVASQYINERPFLGFGASGFWDNPVYRNDIFLLQSLYGDTVFSFHNLQVELLVMLGPLGLIFHSLGLLTVLSRATAAVARDADILALWVLVFVAAIYVMATFGSQLFQQHDFSLLFVVMFGVVLSLHQGGDA